MDYVNGHGVLDSVLAICRAVPEQAERRDTGGEQQRTAVGAERLQGRDSAVVFVEER